MKQCILCGNKSPVPFIEKKGRLIVRCGDCGLKYLDLDPGEQELEALYSEDYFVNRDCDGGYGDYFAGEKHLKINFRRRIRILERFVSGGTLLDIGCGPGFFLESLSSNWNASGIDISAFACDAAARRHNPVSRGLFAPARFEPESFDAVTLWNMLEHFNDPLESLKGISSIMKPGGVCGIYTCNAESLFARLCGKYWHLFIIPEHLYYFSRRTLDRLLHEAGFEILYAHSEFLRFSLDYLVERVYKAFGKNPDRTRRPGVVKAILNGIVLPVNFFDTITVYARKK